MVTMSWYVVCTLTLSPLFAGRSPPFAGCRNTVMTWLPWMFTGTPGPLQLAKRSALR